VVSAARDLGIKARLSAVPSLALGAAEVSLLDLTGAFASVRGGRTLEPWGIAAFGAENQTGLRSMGPPVVSSGQTLGRVQQPMIELLQQVVERGTGRAAALGGFAAGKTGTSQNHRDAWFIGFNESLVVGVWVGNDDGSPMDRVVGGTVPASIWKRFMTEAAPLVDRETPRISEFPGSEMNAFAHEIPTDLGGRTSASQAQGGRCDHRACASTYRSFRQSDCTYQSYSGERKVCEMRPRLADGSEAGERSSRAVSSAEGERSAGDISARDSQATGEVNNLPQNARRDGGPQLDPKSANAARAQCDANACARKYRSFNASDCTYQPYDRRERQVCEIGAQSATSPQQSSPSATERIQQSSGQASEPTEGKARRFGRPDPEPRPPSREPPRGFFRLF
jgi:penicillin-binding protein 1A